MTQVCRAPETSFNGVNSDGSFGPLADESNSSTPRSPRCEAFVMTGDKILQLNAKISPSYAKVRQEQLPPNSMIVDDCPRRRGPFDDFPSMHHRIISAGSRRRYNAESAVPSSHSDQAINDNNENHNDDLSNSQQHHHHQQQQQQNSSITVHNLSLPTTTTTTNTNNNNHSDDDRQSCSEPVSPARQSTRTGDSSEPGTSLKERLVRLGADLGPTRTVSEKDADAACRLAQRLFRLDGFKLIDVAGQLAKNNDFGSQVTHEYLQLFGFAGLRLDAAIRNFLSHFCLTGESSDRERILEHFSMRYFHCNPSLFSSEDEVHTLTCSILLLNSDLHGQNLRKRMTIREFISNLSHLGYVYKKDLLKSIYNSIKNTPIEWASDNVSGYSASSSTIRENGCKKPIDYYKNDLESQVEYKSGWVMRKCVYDSDGKRTPYGRRGWRIFYATLKGMVLYLHRDDRGFSRSQYEAFSNVILIHHSLAQKPLDYVKKQHIFRLRTANLGEFLFQTSDPQEVQSWIEALNFVAAAFSTPSLPLPASSKSISFHKPLLPSAPTVLSMREQVLQHDRKVDDINQQLNILRADAPSLKAKGKPVQKFFFKERYLEQEKERYGAYSTLLRSLTDRSARDPDMKESELTENSSYREAIGSGPSSDEDSQ